MKIFSDSLTNKKTLKTITSAFSGYPKPAPVQVIHHATIDIPVNSVLPTQSEELLSAVKTQMAAITSVLDRVRKRQEVLRQAIEHAEALPPVIVPADESRSSSKSKRKGGASGPTEDKQCAWDPRLVWTDEEVTSWGGGTRNEDEEDNAAVCDLAKRRCDKHSGWQKTVMLSLEVEEKQLVSQTAPHTGSRRSCTDEDRSGSIWLWSSSKKL